MIQCYDNLANIMMEYYTLLWYGFWQREPVIY